MNGGADDALSALGRGVDGGGDSVAADQGGADQGGGGGLSGFQSADDKAVNYIFPVEVIVVGALSDEDRKGIHQQIWADLGDAMANQNV